MNDTGRRSSALHYRTWGSSDAPALVLLHGFMGRADDFGDLAEELSADRYCVALDLPGHSGSAGLPESAYRFESAAMAVRDSVDQLDLRSPALYGYSMGARLALHLALNSSDRWCGLIMESGSPGLATESERELRINSDESLARQIESESLESFLRKWLAQPLFATLEQSGLTEEVIRSRLNNDPVELAKALRGMSTGRQPSHWDDLGRIAIPTLLITGSEDLKFTSIARQMAAANGTLDHTVVDGAGHNVHLERTRQVGALVMEFLNKTGVS